MLSAVSEAHTMTLYTEVLSIPRGFHLNMIIYGTLNVYIQNIILHKWKAKMITEKMYSFYANYCTTKILVNLPGISITFQEIFQQGRVQNTLGVALVPKMKSDVLKLR